MARSSSPRAKISRGVPSIATRPWFITITRPAREATSSIEWLTITIVVPASRCSARISPRISSRPRGSSPAQGSSSTSTCGSMASTPAIATRRICPPESSKTDRS